MYAEALRASMDDHDYYRLSTHHQRARARDVLPDFNLSG